ncbi:ABC transporter substrate-binding protein [Amaricoccus macauensis]|uniref:ABC transporter substrate-binding protein n=1 Tax=Amaricoccus macauensis TaxID=57001 RepID=UPI003C7CC59A
MKSLKALSLGVSTAALLASAASAEVSDGVVKIGILTDMSGTYSDLAGQGAVTAAQMAIDDFGGEVAGAPIELVSADHQNKADIAANTARQWGDDEQVDVFGELVTTSTALAVFEIAKQQNKIALVTGAASSPLTNDACIPTGFHWAYNTRALAVGTGSAVVAEGGDSWYFLTADYAFGESLQNDVAAVVEAEGGTVLGSIKHPFPATDFSSFVLQAQASGAKVIGLANAGADTTNAIRAANEFGVIASGQSIAALLMFITDVNALGLDIAQGIQLTTGFYWDYNDDTRAWSAKYEEKMGSKPTMVHAGIYSAVSHYLKAVEETGTDDTDTVAAKMKETPVNDFFAPNGVLRSDGRMVHDMYLAQVKAPGDSEGPWDYYDIVRVIPGEEAYGPLEESTCPTK